ncbi:85/88 kDa calcium-independent phospholipase A2 [Clonorchis sinensis]|uniref:phospholipase A2 n=1 Tax=Clonorchis sinensis TaxID=79923 RepID=A0A8T1M3K3_CLOSI|nr:85/88 kDa calcium-independent phospholipase A2 [Clonorchis sinensis]
MTSFSKYVSNVVKTALSSFLPNKVVAYTQRQYEAEYSDCEILSEREPLFYFIKVANHFEMTYIPRISVSITGEEEPYAFSLFRFQGDEESGLAAFARHVEVLMPLHLARVSLNLSCDRVLIERITALCREQYGWTAAHIAAALPWPEVFYSSAVKAMLNCHDPCSGLTPLRIAVAGGDIKLLECLLSLPALRLDGVDNQGDTILHLAAKQNSSQLLSLLLDNIKSEVDVNALNTLGNTALHTACLKPSRDCVEQLINAGADPTTGLRELPLQLVVLADSLECVDVIYQAHPDALNCPQQSDLAYPIHLATNTKMFRRLCELGANLDSQDASGQSVLHKKVTTDDLECVLYLLACGADTNIFDVDGRTPLHVAVAHNASIHILRALLVFEADPSVLDNCRQSPRHMLCSDADEYMHSPQKDLALYTLHAVGAKRCPPDLEGCTVGCMDPGTAAEKGLTLFDGTAPEVVHNTHEDAAHLFDEIFYSASQLPRINNVQQRRFTRYSASIRRTSKLSSHTEAELYTLRSVSPSPSSSTDVHTADLNHTFAASANGPRRSSSGRISSSTILIPAGAAQPCRFTVESDPEEKLSFYGSSGSPPQKRQARINTVQPHRIRLHFVPRDCSCEESFLNERIELQSKVDEPVVILNGNDDDPATISRPTHSIHSSTTSLLSDRSLGEDEPDSTCCPNLDDPDFLQEEGDEDITATVGRRRKLSSRWNCGPAGYRVLALDGGGIRGLILVQILRALERVSGKQITDLFDWFVGTSSGGILALMLLRGKCLRCCRNLLFTFKDTVFCGKRPYSSDEWEKIMRREMGENTKMTDLKGIRVAVTTLLSDRCPPVFHMFRNYTSPRLRLHELLKKRQQELGWETAEPGRRPSVSSNVVPSEKNSSISSSSSVLNFLLSASGFLNAGESAPPEPPVESECGHKFDPIITDAEQLVWRAARATGAAPTYFRPCGRFLDGGLISNNPTLDLLTEIQEMQMVQQLQDKPPTPLAVVVSLGTGRMPVEPIETVDVFRPQSLMETFRSAMGFSSLGRIIVEVATMTEGPVVDRASAWCASLGVPFFRFSPRISLHITLDTTDTKELLQMVWETEAYLYRARDRLERLASML